MDGMDQGGKGLALDAALVSVIGSGDPAAKVVSLDAVRQRRAYIALAHTDAHWCQVRASFALSGIELTDDEAERAGRVIAGVITYEEAREEISAQYRQEE